MLLFGFCLTTEVKNTKMAVYDPSKDVATQGIIRQLEGTGYFSLVRYLNRPDEIETVLQEGAASLVVVFGENFQENLLHTGEGAVQLVADATDPNQARAFTGYAEGVIGQWIMENGIASYLAMTGGKNGIASYLAMTGCGAMTGGGGAMTGGEGAKTDSDNEIASFHAMTGGGGAEAVSQTGRMNINCEIRMLYNPQMKGAYNFVPGVMGLILMLICAMMTSISIVREKERGTMEVLLASPMKPLYIILSKVTPYFALAIADLAVILLTSYFVLGVPIAGNMLLLISLSLLFLFVALSFGLLVSNVVDTQVAAMLIAGMGFMMPTMLLSGMMFPIESMPAILQYISTVIPARWYMEAVRKVMIQGVDIRFVTKEIAVLAGMIAFLLTATMRTFKIRLQN
jgi:ABC-2 type transport system permease protein